MEGMQSTLIHETQHAIQSIEGFARGGQNHDWLMSGGFVNDYGIKIITDYINSFDNKRDKKLKHFGELLLRGERSKAEKIRLKLKLGQQQIAYKIANMIDSFTRRRALRLNPYDYLGGEVEARNTQARRYMTNHERRTTPLSETQKTDTWLIRGTDNPSDFTVLTDYDTGYSYDNAEQYHQIIGEQGAHKLDEMEGVTTRIDNLAEAKRMQAQGKDARAIRRATGWELAPDGKWRYELSDTHYDLVDKVKEFEKRYRDNTQVRRLYELKAEEKAIWDEVHKMDKVIPARLTKKYSDEEKAKYRAMRKEKYNLIGKAIELQEEIKELEKNSTYIFNTS